MTDNDAREILNDLLPASYELNEIFWGKGLEVKESEGDSQYLPVSEDCPYKSIDEVLEAASEVFSSQYIENIKAAIFEGTDVTYPRYKEINGVLQADTANTGFNIVGNINPESAKIVRQHSSMMQISAEYYDGDSLELTLVLENGKWLLNSPTY